MDILGFNIVGSLLRWHQCSTVQSSLSNASYVAVGLCTIAGVIDIICQWVIGNLFSVVSLWRPLLRRWPLLWFGCSWVGRGGGIGHLPAVGAAAGARRRWWAVAPVSRWCGVAAGWLSGGGGSRSTSVSVLTHTAHTCLPGCTTCTRNTAPPYLLPCFTCVPRI